MPVAYAVIFQRSRRPIMKKFKKGSNTVSVNDKTYMLDPDCAIFDTVRVFGFPIETVKFYFVEDCPTPIPLPELKKTKRIGIEPDDLEILLDPKLYHMLIDLGEDKYQKLTMYITLLLLLAMMYALYRLEGIAKAAGI